MPHVIATFRLGVAAVTGTEISSKHYLVKKEASLLLIGNNKHALIIKSEHLLHNVHKSLHETQHANALENLDTLHSFLGCRMLLKDIIVVEYLTHSNTIIKQMTIYMYWNIYKIEQESGHKQCPGRRVDGAYELMLLSLLEESLQTLVRERIVHPCWTIMELYSCVGKNWEVDMMINGITFGDYTPYIFHNPITTTFDPDINVPATRNEGSE